MTPVDAFELPEWLGTTEVTWHADRLTREGHSVLGHLSGADSEFACDLLAIDQAYPAPVADDATRRDAHQAWRNSQVSLVEVEGRLTLAVPGTHFTADRILTVLGRLAKAVGARPDRFVAALRLGVVHDEG
ncbi:MAG: hypothetical protein L0H93_05240 [Nocardioides sp.]|nr:hypothetical protein [Nocardioides sp.]